MTTKNNKNTSTIKSSGKKTLTKKQFLPILINNEISVNIIEKPINQVSISLNIKNKTTLLETKTSSLIIYQFDEIDKFSKQLWKLPLIEKPVIVLYGKEVRQGRDVNFFSDDSVGYKYSGKIMNALPLTDELKTILSMVNNKFNDRFNGILVNCYRTGLDCIGAHSDDEKSLGDSGVISLSLGATRKFRIRDKITKKIVLDFPISHGCLIHMNGEFQKEFTHEIPKEMKIKESRLSLTFRNHIK
jgi:alkylated DNA repair dioxygenase AlkB